MRIREGRDDSRYEQLYISPEAVEQELSLAVCEQRQTYSYIDNCSMSCGNRNIVSTTTHIILQYYFDTYFVCS